MHATLLIATVAAVMAQAPAGQVPAQPTEQPGVTIRQVPPGDGNPALFQNLFVPEAEVKDAQVRAAREQLRMAVEARRGQPNGSPKVVCGMVVIQADPTVDPRMILRPAPGTGTTAHIKRIPPAACAE